MIRTYTELIRLPTFAERFRYLKLDGSVGNETFGWDRYLNQAFYHSKEWKDLRNYIIVRDNGCDLATGGYGIPGKIVIHHMNPVSLEDVLDRTEYLFNPEYLICTTHETHNAIHYGADRFAPGPLEPRSRNDTCPWK